MTNSIVCDKCGHPLATQRGGKLKLFVKSRLIAFTEAGQAEMVCPNCHQDTPLPITLRVASAKKDLDKQSILR